MQTTVTNRHTETTRHAILQAGVELLLERSDDGFTVQEVADRAGLTHRTVYRYFPARQELMAAVARSLVPDLDDFRDVSTTQQWIEAVAPHLARTEANLTLVRRLLAAVLASDDPLLVAERTGDRDAHRWQVFRAEFPDLAEADARRTFATLRHLTSSSSYVLYRLRFAMSPSEAVETIRAAALQIVEQTAARNRAAAREVPGDG
jgi:AcrR family transcriptional regulator